MDQIAEEIYVIIYLQDNTLETIRQNFHPSLIGFKATGHQPICSRILMLIVATTINLITVLLILILDVPQNDRNTKSSWYEKWSFKKIFLFHGVQILSRGLFWGNITGILVAWFKSMVKVIKLNETDYYLKVAPIHLGILPIVFINIGTVLITRIDPLDSNRIDQKNFSLKSNRISIICTIRHPGL